MLFLGFEFREGRGGGAEKLTRLSVIMKKIKYGPNTKLKNSFLRSGTKTAAPQSGLLGWGNRSCLVKSEPYNMHNMNLTARALPLLAALPRGS